MKRILLILKLSLRGILTNKIRSLLSVLGIVIGIASVIAMLSLGQGAQEMVTDNINSLGTNTITITAGGGREIARPGQNNPVSQGQITESLKIEDYEKVKQVSSGLAVKVSPLVNGVKEIKHGDEEQNITINGVNEEYLLVNDLEIETGDFVLVSNLSGIVLGPGLKEDLFSDQSNKNVLGQEVDIQNQKYEVVGILKSKESTMMGDPDKQAYISYQSALDQMFDTDQLSSIKVKVENEDQVSEISSKIETELAAFRQVDAGEPDFSINTSEDMIKTVTQITDIFTLLLAGIAAISLVVGGIGISNIMIASVTERTKEIGLRKAIGAKNRDVLAQFLIESVYLTLAGGILGVAFGIVLAKIIGNIIDFPTAISINNILLASSVAIGVGIIFGFIPAYNASRLDPIEALRYE